LSLVGVSFTDLQSHWSPQTLRLDSRAVYWSQMTYFQESVVLGLIWYIRVSLLHQGYFADNSSFDYVKTGHPLMSFIHSEAVRLFTRFYQAKNSTNFIVLDCTVYPVLNGYTGQILSFIQQNGQYTVSVKSTKTTPSPVESEFTHTNTQSTSTCFIMQIHSQHLEPLHRVKEFGLNKLSNQEGEEVVSLPNLLCGGDLSSPHIKIMFNLKVFELMRKRFLRPENIPSNKSTNALLMELSKMDNQARLKYQHNTGELFEKASIHDNLFTPFQVPFQKNDKTVFKSGCNLTYFSFDTSSNTNWDDVLHSVYAKEGTIELTKTTFDTLIPGQKIDFRIIDLCLKW
jgi:hypothetical protein